MINAYHLTDAIPAALFLMFALWAAASKRHWFLRTAVTGGALLIALLIPAYEVVIEFGIAILLIVGGLAIWRRRREPTTSAARPARSRRFRPRLSLQSLLLMVVIVAVVTAVAARAPQMTIHRWYQLAVVGVACAAAGLASVWIVCGRAPWWIRLLAAPLLVIFFALQVQGFLWTGNIVRHWLLVPPGKLGEYLQVAWRDIELVASQWTISIGLGMAVLCAWLFFMRRAGWFDPFNELQRGGLERQTGDRGTQTARRFALGVLVLVAMFPLALLYRLLTPPPFPAVAVPEPNGFDDLVAAAKMIEEASGSRLSNWSTLTDAQLQAGLAGHDAAFERMRQGLERPCVNPNVRDWPGVYFDPLLVAAAAKAELARRTGALEEKLAAYWDYLRLAHEATRGTGAHWYRGYASGESWAINGLWDYRDQLSAPQCIELAVKLRKFDARRDSWESQRAQQRIFDANRDWQSHLPIILADWSGSDPYEGIQGQQRYFRSIIQLRILIVELGLRAYRLERGHLPATLIELVPDFLLGVPQDPYGDGQLKYRRAGKSYTIYSLGIDRDDDRGQPPLDSSNGDFTRDYLFPPAPTRSPTGAAPTTSGAVSSIKARP